MTEIREPNFTLDLPGDWEQTESDEPVKLVFHAKEGTASVSVALLGVKPLFAIADPSRMLEDYLHHRPQFELGRSPSLEQSEPTSWQVGDAFVGEWSARELATGRRMQHHVVLVDNLLADFAYEETEADEATFAEHAAAVLGSATASA